MSDESRLERIEKKLDDMATAIVSLARMEERMLTLFKRMDKLDNAQDSQEQRLQKVERNLGTNGQAVRFAERLFWIITSAGLAYLFYLAKGGE
jgi:hypothetical protein